LADLDDRQRDYLQNVQLEYVKMAHAEWLEGFKGVKDFSSNAIRMLYVLNGGALIALLALIGNIYSKIIPGDQLLHFEKFLKAILPAFLPFAVGLLLAGIVSALAYANYSSIEASFPNSSRLYLWLKGEEVKQTVLARQMPTITARVGFFIALLSLGAFGWGCWRVYQAFEILADAQK
jgi:hypothetical protein